MQAQDTEKHAVAGGYNGWHLLAGDVDTGEVSMDSV